MTKKSINHLKADHQRILQALDVLRRMAEQVEIYGNIEREDVLEILEFFHSFAHHYHDSKEHLLLLPAVTKPGSADAKAGMDRVESDHQCTSAAMNDLFDAYDQGDNARFVEAAMAYVELMATHIFTEDRFLFSGMEKNLTTEEDEQLLHALESFQPALRQDGRIRFDDVVYRLGEKYRIPQCA